MGHLKGGVLEVAARIVQLGGAPERAARVAELRAGFEARTGSFVPEDAWFEERSRAFWSEALTRGRFGRAVEVDLDEDERRWLGPLERAHRGLFRLKRLAGVPREARTATGGDTLADVWSGAEFRVTLLDELGTRPELEASLGSADGHGGQLFDARVVAVVGAGEPLCVALLPGPVFHSREATAPIHAVLDAARDREMKTEDVLDSLLRMERTLRSLSRVKASYAYRPEALSPRSPAGGAEQRAPFRPVRREGKAPR